MQPHACPDCKCEPLCELCHGNGFITEWIEVPSAQSSDSWGSGGVNLKPCPNGCPPPMAFYSANTTTWAA